MEFSAKEVYIYAGLVSFTICFSLAYEMKCPLPSQWNMRAFKHCINFKMYICLSNGYNTYTENCTEPDRGPEGRRIVLKGGFDHGNCTLYTYQPFIFSTIGNSDCVYLKSHCHEEGQVIHSSADGQNDRECVCDYTKGYAFLFLPAKNSSCVPSLEDCTCYKKCIVEDMILAHDFSCINKNVSLNGTYSTFKTTTNITPNVDVENAYQRNNRIWILLAVGVSVLFCVLISTCFCSACTSIFKDRCMVDRESRSSIEMNEHRDTSIDANTKIIDVAQKIHDGPPAIYRIPLVEITTARNIKANSRKFVFEKKCVNVVEKTMLIVGETGAGKTTFIDAMANYLAGVNFNDTHRYRITIDESSETHEMRDQTISQTERITSYSIPCGFSTLLDYNINIIDTPGFGDTRGIHQDKTLIEQIRSFFATDGEQGLPFIDAVCFVTPTSTVRLTKTQTYIIESVLSLFGNDIKDNFCTIITFSDGNTPRVIGALKKIEEVPLLSKNYFDFNCCNLFPETERHSSSLVYWEMGLQSCKSLLQNVKEMETKSIQLSKEVLENRKVLEQNSIDLNRFISEFLLQLSTLQKTKSEQKHENARESLTNEIKDKEMQIHIFMEANRTIINRLGKIALSPNVSLSQLIDLLISHEKQRKRDGYQLRIKTLTEYKEKVLYEPRLVSLRKLYSDLM